MAHWFSLSTWHGTQPWRSERHVTITLETDSSSRRWGGRILLGELEFRAGDDWTGADCGLHINLLEMMAFYNVLLSFRSYLGNSLVDCYIDNRSAMFNLINGGGRSLEMTEVAKLIFNLQREENFDIVYHWIPSSQNSVADAISREESPLRLRPSIFRALDQQYGGFWNRSSFVGSQPAIRFRWSRHSVFLPLRVPGVSGGQRFCTANPLRVGDLRQPPVCPHRTCLEPAPFPKDFDRDDLAPAGSRSGRGILVAARFGSCSRVDFTRGAISDQSL